MTLPATLVLLRYKLVSFFKVTAEMNFRNVAKNVASMVVFGGFAVGSFYFSRATTMYVLDQAHLGVFLLHRFISMLLYVFFFSVNIGNIIVSYATLYRSKETVYLLTKPVPHTSLFVIKFLDNFFYSSTTLFLIAIAVLLGYGSYFHVSWVFYIQAMVLLFIPFMLLSASIAVCALMLLMHLARKVGIKIVLACLGAGYVGMMILYFKMTSPLDLVSNVMKYYPNVDQYYGFLEPAFARYLPNQWVSEALYWMVRGNPAHVASYTFLLLDSLFIVFVIMLAIAKKLFYASWLTSLELRARSEARASTIRFMSFARRPLLNVQNSVLLKKEFWLFFREPSQWVHVIIISMLIIVFLGSVTQIQLGLNGKLPFLQTVSYLVLYIFNTFLVSSISLRFVYPMMSTEGKSFWAVLSAPVRLQRLYFMKYIIALVPILITSLLLGVASYAPLRGHRVLLDVAMEGALFSSIALVGLNLGSGTFFGDFSETNPIRVSSSQGATITFVLGLLYLVFLVGVLFVPLFHYFESLIHHAPFQTDKMMSIFTIIGFGSLVVAFVSSAVGLRSLRRDF